MAPSPMNPTAIRSFAPRRLPVKILAVSPATPAVLRKFLRLLSMAKIVYQPYVVWPLIVLAVYSALCFVAARAVYYPARYPEGWWDVQSRIAAAVAGWYAAGGLH